MKVRCPSCFREERWRDGEREVVLQGGRRQPTGHPALTAWNTLVEARGDGRFAMGPCVCGQPMLGEAGPWQAFTVHTPQGPLQVFDTGQVRNGTPVSDQAVQDELEAAYGPKWDLTWKSPFLAAFQAVAFLSVVAPFLLWVAAALTVTLLLFALLQPVGFGR